MAEAVPVCCSRKESVGRPPPVLWMKFLRDQLLSLEFIAPHLEIAALYPWADLLCRFPFLCLRTKQHPFQFFRCSSLTSAVKVRSSFSISSVSSFFRL